MHGIKFSFRVSVANKRIEGAITAYNFATFFVPATIDVNSLPFGNSLDE
jgi:hypothetical protein